jgi:hypothetical protein
MGITKKESQLSRQLINTGAKMATDSLDASTTVNIVRFGTPVAKVSFQGSDTLAGTIEFSINGVNWTGSTAIPGSNAIGSFATHNVTAVRVTRTSGSGFLTIAATA